MSNLLAHGVPQTEINWRRYELIMKPRCTSLELKTLRFLKTRMLFSAKEDSYYQNLEKGLEGEKLFDDWLENLAGEGLFLNDLLLEYNNTLFQIDTLLISPTTIYLFEVKNYEGDFFVETDRWYSLSKKEIKNPLLQLKRNESLFRRLLQDLGISLPIEPYLIFVNPEFQLYQAPLNLPIIFRSQLKRFMTKLKKNSSAVIDRHSKLAEQLVSVHLNETPYSRFPAYNYDQLKKGLTCRVCQSLDTDFTNTFLICNMCGNKEDNHAAILRNVEEFTFLFPNKKITTNTIYDWCNIIKNKKTICRVLAKNYIRVGHGKSSYYVMKD
jgi:hypothetical protein